MFSSVLHFVTGDADAPQNAVPLAVDLGLAERLKDDALNHIRCLHARADIQRVAVPKAVPNDIRPTLVTIDLTQRSSSEETISS
jgi:hypothetical protein